MSQKVLWVDDEPYRLTRERKRLVRDLECQVDVVVTVREAQRRLAAEHVNYDLVIIDQLIPIEAPDGRPQIHAGYVLLFWCKCPDQAFPFANVDGRQLGGPDALECRQRYRSGPAQFLLVTANQIPEEIRDDPLIGALQKSPKPLVFDKFMERCEALLKVAGGGDGAGPSNG